MKPEIEAKFIDIDIANVRVCGRITAFPDDNVPGITSMRD
jgi:hypothetical protein